MEIVVKDKEGNVLYHTEDKLSGYLEVQLDEDDVFKSRSNSGSYLCNDINEVKVYTIGANYG